jgi:hypothetical protein
MRDGATPEDPMNRTTAAMTAARKYRSIIAADRAATSQRYLVSVLHGCDGRYWVPSCPAHETILVTAGYQPVPR